MRITFVTRKFGNVERNSHCDVLHISPVRVARLVLDCNGVFAKKAYGRASDSATRFTATDCPPTETCLSKANQIQMAPTRTVVTRTRLSNLMRTINPAPCQLLDGGGSFAPDRWQSFRQRNRFKLDKMA